MTKFKFKFGQGDFPTAVVAIGTEGEDPRRLTELANTMAARAASARIGQRLFGHSLASTTKDGLMRCGQSWWEHTYKGGSTDVQATHRYVEFAQAQGEPFHTLVTNPPDCLIYLGAARWADQGFPTLTMGEKLAAALCGTEIPEDMYDDIKAPWEAFVIEIPSGLFTVFDPEHQVRTRATRILVHHVVDGDGNGEWWWMLFSEKDQHFWRNGTTRQVLHPVTFREPDTEKYKLHGGPAFAEHVSQDERLYHIVSRLVFNSILTLLDSERIRPVGSSHKRYAERGREPGHTPEQRVFIVGKPIDLDCRQQLRDYLEGRSKRTFKITAQFLVHGHWRWQPWGPKHSLRRRQWIVPYWKGPEDGIIPVRDHKLGEEPSDP